MAADESFLSEQSALATSAGCQCDACLRQFAIDGTKIDDCTCGCAGDCSGYCSACSMFNDRNPPIPIPAADESFLEEQSALATSAGCQCEACLIQFAKDGTKIDGCTCGSAGTCSGYCSACAIAGGR